MNKYEIVKKIENFAPIETQEKWDMSGWIVNNFNKTDVKRVMFALTITADVVEQAKEQNCDMIISHHPLFYVPLEFKTVEIYSAHTNFDLAHGGTTDTLIKELKFQKSQDKGFVRIVKLENPISVEEFKTRLLKVSPKLRYVNNKNIETINSIGFCAGSGSEFINETDTDAYVTGDLKFHTALDSTKVLFDIGHFESEIFAPKRLWEISEVGKNGVIANEKSPFI